MTHKQNNWLARSDFTTKWILGVSLFFAVILMYIQNTTLGDYIDQKGAMPFEVYVRQKLSKDTLQSPNLKVLVLDDSAFSKLDDWVLSVEHWYDILSEIDQKQPKAIFIDMMWSKSVRNLDHQINAREMLSNIKSPIILGGAVRPYRSDIRSLPLHHSHYSLQSRIENLHDLPPMPYLPGFMFYGAEPEISSQIKKIGHFNYNGSGKIAPFVRLNFDTIIPHVFTFLDEDWKLLDKKLVVNNTHVNLDKNGELPINFINPKDFYQNAISLKHFLPNSKNQFYINKIKKDDIVVILPLFYTGNTDFKWTPYGYVPAGIVPASLMNSVITKNWLHPINFDVLLIGGMTLFGAICSAFLGPVIYWIWVTIFTLLWVSFAVLGFSYFNLQMSWIIPYAGFFLSGLSVYVKKARSAEIKTRAIRQALQGNINDHELSEILKNPSAINLEPKERVVTLMFIDIVGFSLISENMAPRKVFESLKETINEFTKIIHQYNGVVDKTLGDGLLCYFGYSFDNDSTYLQHAEFAVKAAIDIQKQSIRDISQAHETGKTVMPLRIGINTATCFIGDLGYDGVIEFTVIGNGVNFAKRLEGACTKHSIMISKTTKDLLSDSSLMIEHISKKYISIKHHTSKVEAYELNILKDFKELDLHSRMNTLNKAENRKEFRCNLYPHIQIHLHSKELQGILINYSNIGFSLLAEHEVSPGQTINFSFLNKEVQTIINHLTFTAEIKWILPSEDKFMYGLTFVHLDDLKKSELINSLNKLIIKSTVQDVKESA